MKIKELLLLSFLAGSAAVSAREVIDFNKGWAFRKAPATTDVMQAATVWNGRWDSVSVPHTWNAHDMQRNVNNFYEGTAYYKKTFDAPAEWNGKRIFLRFEGVGACAEVYVNGRLTGSHRGGYSAFACEISGELKAGARNEVVVKADNAARPDVIPVNHQLFGVYGGIYRPVQLIVAEPCHIAVTDHASSGVYITQRNVSRRSADVKIRVKLDNGSLRPVSLVLETLVSDAEGKTVAASRHEISLSAQGLQNYDTELRINKPHLWQGRRDPYLYRVTVRLTVDGRVVDECVQPLGLRHFEVVAGKGFYLNGERYPMYGVTRHQDRWGKGSALTKADHDEDLAAIMDVGATTIRLAHYQQSDYFYSRCDSLGLIVWAEIPFVNRVTGKEWENAHSQLRELIRQNFNHPSIYVWGLHNEVYHPHAYTAQLTQSLHDLAKTEDPDRYTASVNGYGTAEHPVNMNADIQGMNRYFGWYEKRIGDIVPWVEGLEKSYPDMPLMLTEYGADANLAHQTEFTGDALNWTKEFYPEQFQTKTHEYHWSVIARHPYIVASYLWNMFDFACPMWKRGGVAARNMKGLVTFDRKTKKDAYYWYKANWSEAPVLYMTERRNTDRETRVTRLTVYSNVGQPRVYLNGRELQGCKKGFTDVHYVFDDVTLVDGENVLRAVAADKQGNELSDEMTWHYSGEKRRTKADAASEKEHSGF